MAFWSEYEERVTVNLFWKIFVLCREFAKTYHVPLHVNNRIFILVLQRVAEIVSIQFTQTELI